MWLIWLIVILGVIAFAGILYTEYTDAEIYFKVSHLDETDKTVDK